MTRRSPNLAISIPPGNPAPTRTPSTKPCRPTSRPLLRAFPWVVGCTLVLWIFVLYADRPPLHVHIPQTHSPVNNWRPRPFHPLHRVEESSAATWAERAERVQRVFRHAYDGYTSHSEGYDELLPVTGGKAKNFNGWGLTLFDALGTMWTMGLHNLFRESLGAIARTNFTLPEGEFANFHDSTHRYLGGLLSAYALSRESMLLTRADDLGKSLLTVYNSSSGLPSIAVDSLGQTSMEGKAELLLTTVLTGQLEFRHLAHVTGRADYFLKVEAVMKSIERHSVTLDALPSKWDPNTGLPANTHYSVGEHSDTALPTLLKQWVLTAKLDRRSLDLYLKYANYIIQNLLFITKKRRLLYVTDIDNGQVTHRFEHLSCSLPGLLALGVHNLGISLPLRDRELHLWAAQGLAYTCWVTYADQMSGLGPEEVQMEAWLGPEGEQFGRWMQHVEEWETRGKKGTGPPGTKQSEKYESSVEEREYVHLRPWYLLKAELIESCYILWKTTKNGIWRERGWSIFEAIERQAKTEYGYAGILQVDQIPTPLKDEMPSYFLGETLKYLYLLFTNEDPIPLNSWVFNTKGHPFPVFKWSDWEKQDYNIKA